MQSFEIRTIETTSGDTKKQLEQVQRKLGFVPTFLGTFASAPVALNAYLNIENQWERSSFSPEEQNIVLLASSVENNCPYCTAVYATALRKLRISEDVISSIISKKKLEDKKWNVLVHVTKDMVESRGFAAKPIIQHFIDAGYTQQHLIELLIGVAVGNMSNYLEHMIQMPMEKA